MSDILRIVGGSGKTINLYPWLAAELRGAEALAGITGFGLMEQRNQWFQGSGNGNTWRSATIGPRTITIPLWVYAENRTDLQNQISGLAVALDPRFGESRLEFADDTGSIWTLDVVRSGKLDWARKVDSDDRKYFKTQLTLEAGDPFWTRSTPSEFYVTRVVGEQTFLPKIAELRVTSGAAFGQRDVENIGDAESWPQFTITGPATHLDLIGPNGETVLWDGTLLVGQTLHLDMRTCVIVDSFGNNRYDGFGTAPRFWSIAPGTSRVTVQALGSSDTTTIHAQWWPRRQAAV